VRGVAVQQMKGIGSRKEASGEEEERVWGITEGGGIEFKMWTRSPPPVHGHI
jgi:hypothetical protein